MYLRQAYRATLKIPSRLNKRIGQVEQAGVSKAFELFCVLLSDQLIFRRANGKIVYP
jgi:hypothetical protein